MPLPETSWDSAAELEFWRCRCYTSLWWFLREAYGIDLNPLGGWQDERVHKPFCDWLQFHGLDWLKNRKKKLGRKNLMIIVPREFGKTLIARAFLLWLHLHDPELSTFIGSETKEKAGDFFKPVKPILDGSDEYQKFSLLYGNWYDKNRLWRDDKCVHAIRRALTGQAPSFEVWGVATGLTGSHPDVLDLDDPNSYEMYEKNAGWDDVVNSHVASLIPVLKKNGLRMFIGTPYSDSDHLSTTLYKHGAKTVSGQPDLLPIKAEETGLWHVYFLSARDAKGRPTMPSVWPEEALVEFEKDDNLKYWAQARCLPSSSEFQQLTRAEAEKCLIEAKDVPRNLRISFHIDTAFKTRDKQARGDWSVITIHGHSRDGSGDVYVLEAHGSNRWDATQFNNKLVNLLRKYERQGQRAFALTDEAEVGGKQGTWELTLRSWCAQASISPPGKIILINRMKGPGKEARYATAASYWAEEPSKVKLVRDAPGIDILISQMTTDRPRNDDYRDAHADCFHPEVYTPMRRKREKNEKEIPVDPYEGVQPYDDVLKAPTIRAMYEQFQKEQRPSDGPIEPIGFNAVERT